MAEPVLKMSANNMETRTFSLGAEAVQWAFQSAPVCIGQGVSVDSYAYVRQQGKQGTACSPLHNVDLLQGSCDPAFIDADAVAVVVEIPKDVLAKYEVSESLPGNPVVDNEKATKKLQAFGRAPPFNYGIFPQTYCDPEDKRELEKGGDGAALDAIVLDEDPLERGSAHRTLPLGCFSVVAES